MSSFLKQSRAPPPATESPIATDRSSSFEGFGSLFDDDGEELNSIPCRESFSTEAAEEEKDSVETSSEKEEDSARFKSVEEGKDSDETSSEEEAEEDSARFPTESAEEDNPAETSSEREEEEDTVETPSEEVSTESINCPQGLQPVTLPGGMIVFTKNAKIQFVNQNGARGHYDIGTGEIVIYPAVASIPTVTSPPAAAPAAPPAAAPAAPPAAAPAGNRRLPKRSSRGT